MPPNVFDSIDMTSPQGGPMPLRAAPPSAPPMMQLPTQTVRAAGGSDPLGVSQFVQQRQDYAAAREAQIARATAAFEAAKAGGQFSPGGSADQINRLESVAAAHAQNMGEYQGQLRGRTQDMRDRQAGYRVARSGPGGPPEAEAFHEAPQQQNGGGGGGGGAYIPPEYGWQPHSRTAQTQVTGGVRLSQGTKTALGESEGARAGVKLAGERAEKEDVKAATEEDAMLEDRANNARSQYSTYERHEAGRGVKLANERARIEQNIKDIESTRIDPNRYWANQSAAQKGLGMLGSILGGFVEGFTGGKVKNHGLEMLQSSIQEDIEAQKANLANAQHGLASRRNLYGDLVASMGDERAAEAKLSQLKANQFIAQGDSIAVKSKSAHIKDNWAKARLGLAEHAAEQGMKVDQLISDRVTKSESQNDAYGVKPGTGVGGGVAAGHADKLEDDRFVPTGEGQGVYAATKEEGKETRQALSRIRQIQDNIARAAQIRQGTGWQIPGTPSHEALKQLQADSAQTLTVLKGQGAMSKGDQDVANASVGSMTTLLPGGTQRLQAASQRLQNAHRHAIEGLPVVRVGTQTDRYGNVHRTGATSGEVSGGGGGERAAPPPAAAPLQRGR